jgi:hypothetical protein
MITYRTAWSLTVADCWYTADDPEATADILRFLHLAEPLKGCAVEPSETVRIDLTRTEEELLADMGKSNRNHLRKAADCGFRYDFWYPAPATLEFCEETRAREREILRAYADQEALDVSRVSDESGRPLSWRGHYRDRGHARAIRAAAVPDTQHDSDLRNLLARARRHQCWEDLRRFRAAGIPAYDLGRRYSETDDQELLAEDFFQDGFGGGLVKTFSCTRAGTLKGRLFLALKVCVPLLNDRGARP